MRNIVIYSTALFVAACVPVRTHDQSLYLIETGVPYAEQEGWCDQPEPEEGPAVYYVRENGECVAKVK